MTASWWVGGLIVFATVFGFELVDRTSFASIGLATRHDHRYVWVGASLAFVLSTTVAIVIGEAVAVYLGTYLPYVRILGGAIIVLFGVNGLRKRWLEKGEKEGEAVPPQLTPRRVILTSFTLISFLEFGDNTQILTILFVPTFGVWVVFVSALAALVSVAAVSATEGQYLKSRFDPQKLEGVMAAILILVGTATILIGVLELAGVALPSL